MVIRHLGHASFKIRGGKVSIITDPFSSAAVGIKFPRTTADIVTVSHQHSDHNAVAAVQGSPFVISGPGEYEVGGVRIYGIATFHDQKQGAARGRNIVYVFYFDDLAVLHCGDLGHKFTERQLDLFNEIDIALLPVGGIYTIDAETAVEVVAQLEPRIVIPMHYNTPQLKQEVFGKLDGVEKFLKAIGAEDTKAQEKLVLTKSKLPEETTVVILSAS